MLVYKSSETETTQTARYIRFTISTHNQRTKNNDSVTQQVRSNRLKNRRHECPNRNATSQAQRVPRLSATVAWPLANPPIASGI